MMNDASLQNSSTNMTILYYFIFRLNEFTTSSLSYQLFYSLGTMNLVNIRYLDHLLFSYDSNLQLNDSSSKDPLHLLCVTNDDDVLLRLHYPYTFLKRLPITIIIIVDFER